MKKILLLVMVLVGLLSTVSAKEFNEARWQWFYSNANYTGKIDLNTIAYDPVSDTAEVWAVWIHPTERQQRLQSYTIHFNNNVITLKKIYVYRTGSDEMMYDKVFYNTTLTPAPSSGDEALLLAVKGLVGRDAKLAALKKEREEEAQRRLEAQRAEEQKRLEEQKAFEEKQKAAQKEAEKRNRVATIGGILGSLFGI